MPRFWIGCVVLCCSLLSRDAFSMFMYYETRTVPLTRLLSNLEARLTKNTNDFETTYHLARVHSMAYATNLDEITVRKNNETIPVFAELGMDAGVPETVAQPGSAELRRAAMQNLTNAIILYERAILLLKQSTNIAQHQWLIVPTQLGFAWCLDQSGQKEKAISAYRKALRTSWKTEVTGDFDVSNVRKCDVLDFLARRLRGASRS
jgi:hypothetical protein